MYKQELVLVEVGFPPAAGSLACVYSGVEAEGAAPSPDGSAAPVPPDGDESGVSERVRNLRDEAMSVHHWLSTFLRTPSVTSAIKQSSFRSALAQSHVTQKANQIQLRQFGEVIAIDHIHVFRSPDDSNVKEYVVLCVRDRYTGLFAASPAKDSSTDSTVSSLRRFMGRIKNGSIQACVPCVRRCR